MLYIKLLQSSIASSTDDFDEYCDGIKTQFKLSSNTSLHKTATTAESSPPESPKVTFFNPVLKLLLLKTH